MNSRVTTAVFPAAGLGTRFLPATKAQPKEMLSLIDKPLIQYGIEEAVDSGIEKIIIVTGRGKYAIEDHFDESFELEFFLKDKLKRLEDEPQNDVAKILELMLEQRLKSVQSGASANKDAVAIAEAVLREMLMRVLHERRKQEASIGAQKELLETVQKIVSEKVDVCYIRQKEAKGLGHAVLRAKRLVGAESFAAILADDIIDATDNGRACDPCLRQLIEKYESLPKSGKLAGAILAVMKVKREETKKYGIVDVESPDDLLAGRPSKVRGLVEKPRENPPSEWAIIGRYVLAPAIFVSLDRTKPGAGGEVQLTDGLKDLSKTHDIYACPFQGKRYDAGDKLEFLKAIVELAAKRDDLGKEFRDYLKKEVPEYLRSLHLP